MSQYKNHPIYGIGIRVATSEWHCRGLIFNPDDKVTEIKKLEPASLVFKTLAKAEAHALQLCKTWIDEQAGETINVGTRLPQNDLPPVIS